MREEVFKFDMGEIVFRFPEDIKFECVRCGNCCVVATPIIVTPREVKEIEKLDPAYKALFFKGKPVVNGHSFRYQFISTIQTTSSIPRNLRMVITKPGFPWIRLTRKQILMI